MREIDLIELTPVKLGAKVPIPYTCTPRNLTWNPPGPLRQWSSRQSQSLEIGFDLSRWRHDHRPNGQPKVTVLIFRFSRVGCTASYYSCLVLPFSWICYGASGWCATSMLVSSLLACWYLEYPGLDRICPRVFSLDVSMLEGSNPCDKLQSVRQMPIHTSVLIQQHYESSA